MGKAEITEKLRAFLNSCKSQLNKECEVIYFLVGARKVIEHHDYKNEYRYLRFYADWALHTKKDRSFFKEIENLIIGVSSSVVGQGSFRYLDDFLLDLTILRVEVKKFLEDNKLPIDLASVDWIWEKFTHIYTTIISDQPIHLPVKDGTMVINAIKNGHEIRFSTEIKPL